jgi:hypothetical protein
MKGNCSKLPHIGKSPDISGYLNGILENIGVLEGLAEHFGAGRLSQVE